jgi:hypothetical protein
MKNKIMNPTTGARTALSASSHNMRTRLSALLLMLCALCAFALKSEAQYVGFGGPAAVIGTVNSPPVDTNAIGLSVKRLAFSLTGMTNAATSFTGAVYLSSSPFISTNSQLLAQFINNGSNNFSTNFSAFYTNPPMYVILQGGSGTNTTYVQAIYGP